MISEPALGEVIAGRFRLEERLGEGGMGVVYRATQLQLSREVALKLLLPKLHVDARARARFEREARVASALRHPNAVEIYDFGEDQGRMFLAMERLLGSTLRASIGPPLLELPRVLSIGHQVASVLVAAHQIHLVHRDLKPENIFLEAERVVVVDFGLAFIVGSDDLGRHTVEGALAGTPAYVSPEQARGRHVGPASDIYSLGCVLYELVTGRVPFEGEGAQLLSRHMFVPPTPLRDRRHDLPIPAVLEEIILRMMRKRAEDRPSAPMVRDTLAALDPDVTGKHARGRDASHLLGRASRMITAAASSASIHAPDSAARPDPGVDVAVVGPLDVELSLALAANGLLAFSVSDTQPIAGASVIYAPGADPSALASLTTHGVPLVSDSDRADMPRIASLLKAGIDEVVLRPVAAEDLVAKLWRAIRKAERRRV